MKPVLIIRISLLVGLVIGFIIDGMTILGISISALLSLLMLFSFWKISEAYKYKPIFTNYLLSSLAGFGILGISMYIYTGITKTLMQKFGNSNEQDLQAFMQDFALRLQTDPELLKELIGVLGVYLAPFLVLIMLYVVSLIYFRLACINLTEQTGIKMFKKGATLLLIGIPGLLVFGLGAIVMLVGYVMVIVGFFQLTDTQVAEGWKLEEPQF
jgi:uncharacterized membrane protein